jgi:hypothetical protein
VHLSLFDTVSWIIDSRVRITVCTKHQVLVLAVLLLLLLLLKRLLLKRDAAEERCCIMAGYT